MVNELRRRPKLSAVLLLLVASMAWGATFVVVKSAVARTSVLDFLAWRFWLAGALLVALRPAALRRIGRQGVLQGILLGATLFAAYALQTFGLRYTTAAISGFLTGLQVVFVPLFGWVLLARRPGARIWASTMMATAGLAVISLRGLSIGLGELLTVGSAVLFALQIVALGRWASARDAYGLATVQLLTVGTLSLVAAAPRGVALPPTLSMWSAVVLTAVAATAFAFVVQSWAQTQLTPSSVAVVFNTEPLFAALFAWAAGESIGWSVLGGGALVVAAMALLATGPGGRPRKRPLRALARRSELDTLEALEALG